MITDDFSLDLNPRQYDFELLMNELKAEGVDNLGHGLVNMTISMRSTKEMLSFHYFHRGKQSDLLLGERI